MTEIYEVALIPLILGIVEVIKRLGLPVKYTPLTSLVLGLVFGIVFLTSDVKEGVILGLMMGLSSSGLYSGSKTVLEKHKVQEE